MGAMQQRRSNRFIVKKFFATVGPVEYIADSDTKTRRAPVNAMGTGDGAVSTSFYGAALSYHEPLLFIAKNSSLHIQCSFAQGAPKHRCSSVQISQHRLCRSRSAGRYLARIRCLADLDVASDRKDPRNPTRPAMTRMLPVLRPRGANTAPRPDKQRQQNQHGEIGEQK